jgi:hypothetical protein
MPVWFDHSLTTNTPVAACFPAGAVLHASFLSRRPAAMTCTQRVSVLTAVPATTVQHPLLLRLRVFLQVLFSTPAFRAAILQHKSEPLPYAFVIDHNLTTTTPAAACIPAAAVLYASFQSSHLAVTLFNTIATATSDEHLMLCSHHYTCYNK